MHTENFDYSDSLARGDIIFMPGISYWAVVVAAVAAFVVGAVWYSPFLFSKAYMELRGMNRSEVRTQ